MCFRYENAFRSTFIACGLFLFAQTQSFAGDPPLIKASISKCGAKLEYSSAVKSTGTEPAYQLTNLIHNDDNKSVTDLEWAKPDLSTPELKAGETLEGSYGISAYDHDKDAPIIFWYQGCKAPAEAYLQKTESSKKSSSLHSFIRRYSGTLRSEIAAAEITVSKGVEFIQYEIIRRPSTATVGLTGIAPWITSKAVSIAAANAKEYGYSLNFAPAIKMVDNRQLDRLHAEWQSEIALFTKGSPGAKDYVRIRLPASTSDAQLARAKVILVGHDGKLLATGSYATFTPAR